MADEMKKKLQVETHDAIGKLSSQALKNPNFSKKDVKTECAAAIKALRVREKISMRERRRRARIECLNQGLRLENFDFNDEDTQVKFGQYADPMFDSMPPEEALVTEIDSLVGGYSVEEY